MKDTTIFKWWKGSGSREQSYEENESRRGRSAFRRCRPVGTQTNTDYEKVSSEIHKDRGSDRQILKIPRQR